MLESTDVLPPVASFHYLYKDQRLRTYDTAANVDQRNVWQLSADGMAWAHDGCHIRMFKEKGHACPLPGRLGFAVVEESFEARQNRLYFIDGDDNVLPHDRLPDELARFLPFAAFVAEGLVKVLYFDPTVQPYDAQVDYDPKDLKVVRWGPWK